MCEYNVLGHSSWLSKDSYIFKGLETESVVRQWQLLGYQQVSAEPDTSGLLNPWKKNHFEWCVCQRNVMEHIIMHICMEVTSLYASLSFCDCCVSLVGCLTLYPSTCPGGSLQVTNTDVTICSDRVTSCGTSGTEDRLTLACDTMYWHKQAINNLMRANSINISGWNNKASKYLVSGLINKSRY